MSAVPRLGDPALGLPTRARLPSSTQPSPLQILPPAPAPRPPQPLQDAPPSWFNRNANYTPKCPRATGMAKLSELSSHLALTTPVMGAAIHPLGVRTGPGEGKGQRLAAAERQALRMPLQKPTSCCSSRAPEQLCSSEPEGDRPPSPRPWLTPPSRPEWTPGSHSLDSNAPPPRQATHFLEFLHVKWELHEILLPGLCFKQGSRESILRGLARVTIVSPRQEPELSSIHTSPGTGPGGSTGLLWPLQSGVRASLASASEM